jgi:hypothetical protein
MYQPQSLSPEFTKLQTNYPTKYPTARKYEAFSSLLLVHTEKARGTLCLKFANMGLRDWGQILDHCWSISWKTRKVALY